MNGREQHGVELASKILGNYEGVVGTAALEFLLADLMHWCRAQIVDFNSVLGLARKRYRQDRKEKD